MSTPPAPTTGAVSLDQFREAFARRRTLGSHRATLVLLLVEPALVPQVEACVLDVAGTAPEAVHFLRFDGTDEQRAELRSLNRRRDELLRGASAVVVAATSPEALWAARSLGNDMFHAPDMLTEVRNEVSVPWESLSAAIRQTMLALHRSIDLHGLVPARAERAELELEKMYLPLVNLRENPLFPASSPAPRRWLVLGNPGAGKTTFLRHLAFAYASGKEDPLEIGAAVPVLVPLAELGLDRMRRIRPLLDFVVDWLQEHGVSGAGGLRAHLDEVVLLLDGLDEISDPAGRRAVIDEIGRWSEAEMPRAVVITGRTLVVDDLRAEDRGRFQTVNCQELRPEQVQLFLRRFAELWSPESGRRKGLELARRLDVDENLKALARTPLLLVFLAVLAEQEGRLPERRVEIYYRLGELLVDRWALARSMAGPGGLRTTRGNALRVLGPLAWWVLARGGAAATREELHAELRRIEAEKAGTAGADVRANALLDLLQHDTALLVRDPLDRWTFVHPSVAEYFAALDATQDPARWARVLEDPFHPGWQEIVTFAAGYLGTIQGEDARLHELAEEVLWRSLRPGDYDARYPSLLVALVEDQPGWATGDERRMIDRLGEIWFIGNYTPPEQVEIDAIYFLVKGARQSYRNAVRVMLSHWFESDLCGVYLNHLRHSNWWILGREGNLQVSPIPEAAPIEWPGHFAGWLIGVLPRLLRLYGLSADRLIHQLCLDSDLNYRTAGTLHRIFALPPELASEAVSKLAEDDPPVFALIGEPLRDYWRRRGPAQTTV